MVASAGLRAASLAPDHLPMWAAFWDSPVRGWWGAPPQERENGQERTSKADGLQPKPRDFRSRPASLATLQCPLSLAVLRTVATRAARKTRQLWTASSQRERSPQWQPWPLWKERLEGSRGESSQPSLTVQGAVNLSVERGLLALAKTAGLPRASPEVLAPVC